MASLARAVLILLIVSGLVVAIYFLWQRQPKAKAQEQAQNQQQPLRPEKTEQEKQDFITTPKINEILLTPDVKVQGKAKSPGKVLIFTDKLNITTDATNDSFETNITLSQGFNLVNIVALDADYKEVQSITYPIYINNESTEKDINFLSGIVKKIFKETITVTTIDGDLEFKTTTTTNLILTDQATAKPTPSPKSEKVDLRVGDYVAAIGKIDGNQLTATKVEIYRTNKPTISKNFAFIKISTAIKSNKFSAVDQKDAKLLELTLDKNSQIMDKDKKVNASSITKDKTAIIFYSGDETKIVSALYFL